MSKEQRIAEIIYEEHVGDTEGVEWEKALKKAKAINALMKSGECEHKWVSLAGPGCKTDVWRCKKCGATDQGPAPQQSTTEPPEEQQECYKCSGDGSYRGSKPTDTQDGYVKCEVCSGTGKQPTPLGEAILVGCFFCGKLVDVSAAVKATHMSRDDFVQMIKDEPVPNGLNKIDNFKQALIAKVKKGE